MPQTKKICRSYNKSGRCSYGINCKFLHERNTQNDSRQHNRFNRSFSARESSPLLTWQRQLRRFEHWQRTPQGLFHIFTKARELLESEDRDALHAVIEAFTAEEGLVVIKQFVELPASDLRGGIIHFCEVFCHPKALSSLVLEQSVAKIYNFLFGVGGRRGLELFDNVLRHFESSDALEISTEYADSLVSATELFEHVLERNQSAAVSDEYRSHYERFEKLAVCLSSDVASVLLHNAAGSLKRIRQRFGFAGEIPLRVDEMTKLTEQLATFSIPQNPPGELHADGPRHDNDSADIQSVQILPTAGEINSDTCEYLPELNPQTHHLKGIKGLLDRQFRLLREDTVGPLRDSIRDYIQRSKSKNTPDGRKDAVRTMCFENASLVKSFFDQKLGLCFLFAFDQPIGARRANAQGRKQYWKESPNLKLDSCICLLDSENEATFYTVVARDPKSADAEIRGSSVILDNKALKNMNVSLCEDQKQAFVVLSLATFRAETLKKILLRRAMQLGIHSPATLIEFPGTLLASFLHTLAALQDMTKAENLPFADIIAPSNLMIDPDSNSVPRYAQAPGFSYDLGSIVAGETIRLRPGHPFDLNAFQKASSFDISQANAFRHALMNRFALIQGPPGTGKSFVGVRIIQTLLESRITAKLGPILCVCYTNHALDQVLEHLLKQGVTQIVRIGGRSKSDKLSDVNLSKLRMSMEKTNAERRMEWEAHNGLETILSSVKTKLSGLNPSTIEQAIRIQLHSQNYGRYCEIFGVETDEEGFQTVQKHQHKPLKTWLRGGARGEPARHEADVLETLSSAELNNVERLEVFRKWIRDASGNDIRAIVASCREAKAHQASLDRCRMEGSLRVLQNAHIIGVTTTGFAKNIELLRHLRSKVLVVEEAAEIMEAHMLPTLLPSLEHVIAIGDHEQLRPQIANYELSLENPRGKKYSLDVSLFERLIHPGIDRNGLAFATLSTQRRMHPSMSRLIEKTIYPNLRNHESVERYPSVVGIRQRLYWLDHRQNEDPKEATNDSKSNTFEVEMVAALACYLVKQGTYDLSQITILTPYLGQLRKLRNRFGSIFEIVIGDKDKADLAAQEQEDSSDREKSVRAPLGSGLRISTVDNYQGEESDIIIVSLVRSNPQQKPGFLRTSNRINVLLSRARHGMYIIGDSESVGSVQMWSQVIDMLRADSLLGQQLGLCCQQHPDKIVEVSHPDDFPKYAPEGGCDLICNKRLKCGHSCMQKCHAQYLHEAVVCQQPCPRVKETCSHPCRKVCGVPCEDKCQTPVHDIKLLCGHVAPDVTCWESQNLKDYICQLSVLTTVPLCGHEIEVTCHQSTSRDYWCTAACGAILTCGHSCGRRCSECTTVNQEGEKNVNHRDCVQICSRDYATCEHSCAQRCHGAQACEPCKKPCTVRCPHSTCNKKCNEPCAPCAEPCSWACSHQGACDLPCGVPCERLPCSQRCNLLLDCGHQCPSICGEECPTKRYCQTCGDKDIREAQADFIMFSTYEELDLSPDPVIVPPCGHLRAVSDFDGLMDMQKFYEIGEDGSITGSKTSETYEISAVKTCPFCRKSLRSVKRYGRIVKQGLVDEATKRFIVWANSKFVELEEKGGQLQKGLAQSVSNTSFFRNLPAYRDDKKVDDTFEKLTLHTRAQKSKAIRTNTESRSRYEEIYDYRAKLSIFCRQVKVQEQPFRKVWNLDRASRLKRPLTHSGQSSTALGGNPIVPNLKNHLYARLLLLRVEVSILLDFVEIWIGSTLRNLVHRDLTVETSEERRDCLECFDDAKEQERPMEQVQSLVLFAHFASAEIRKPKDGQDAMNELRREALRKLELADSIIAVRPSASILEPQVDKARESLKGGPHSPPTNEEMHAIYQAMSVEFRGTGHWYRCENGHPFTIGECGMPMQEARCPECGSRIGGANHRAVQGVELAGDIEREFSGNA